MKPTNSSFELGHSRAHEALSKKEELTLSAVLIAMLFSIVIGVVIGVAVAL